jgi:hypothetical protein
MGAAMLAVLERASPKRLGWSGPQQAGNYRCNGPGQQRFARQNLEDESDTFERLNCIRFAVGLSTFEAQLVHDVKEEDGHRIA